MTAIRRRITSRSLQTGEKLPSIRGFAASMGVAPSTVVEAYDRLAADGLIYARRGSGFYVAQTVQPFTVSDVGPRLDREVDPFWVSRQSLDAGPEMLKPGCGWMPADWMPTEAMRRALRKSARAGNATLMDYGSAEGSADLRRLLARQMADDGIGVGPDQLLLTGSATQAVDLICRYLIKPGDTVMIDDPGYFNFQALLRAHRVEIIGVPLTPNGPDLGAFDRLAAAHRPKLYITNSVLQNPTGTTLSPHIAHQLLIRAVANDMVIVEDDIFAAFEVDPSPRLAALDGLDRVIRVGSFSKTVSASVRCGYIAARRDWIDDLTDLQVATRFGGPSPLNAALIHDVLSDGGYRKHLEGLKDRLAKARRHTVARLGEIGIEPWVMPRGGIYLWCRLPRGADSADLARRALARDLVLAPGDVFSASQTQSAFMRFNVSQMAAPEVYRILAEELG